MGDRASSGTGSPFRGLQRLQLTMGVQCNVRCTMCYQTDFSARHNMPEAIYKDRLLDVYKHVRTVKLIGGEPTIMKNCRSVARLLRGFPQARVELTTNGVTVDDFWHETFVEQARLVSFSINAATEAVYDKIVILGAYGRVVRNIERLVAARRANETVVRINSVVLKENVGEIASLIRLGAKLGVDSVGFLVDPILSYRGLPPREQVLAELRLAKEAAVSARIAVDGLNKFEEGLGARGTARPAWEPDPRVKKTCAHPFTNLVVDWNGDVRACCNTWVKLGNIDQAPLADLWNGPKIASFREKMRKGDYLWCNPHCEENPSPHRFAILHKTWTRMREDPGGLVVKVNQKARQIAGKWVTVKDRRHPH